MNKSDRQVILEEFREKFTRESPSSEYRELKHEHYLDVTELEQWLDQKLILMGQKTLERADNLIVEAFFDIKPTDPVLILGTIRKSIAKLKKEGKQR